MAAPLTKAKVGTGRSMIEAKARWPACAISSAWSRAVTWPTPVRSAPTAKMNGLPVMPTAWISPASARRASSSTTACRPAIVCGPKVFGLVWSWPLSRVTRASVPAPPGRTTSWAMARVTTSVSKLVSLMAQASVVSVP